MIIRELELTNIRSHGHSLIRFPEGRTLLEGDIGSGKSSVLMAIEFALFGLGSESGGSVLKLGRDNGEVRMVFDVDGAEYEVGRVLQRKAGRVQQSDGYLKTPEETLNLSPSELKEKVLEVLQFNEAPDPKAQSWIYRYAVYTPQEEMKSILALLPEQRLQILRRAFRVEDYKTAVSNAEGAARQFRVDASKMDGVSMGVEDLRGEVEQLQDEEAAQRAEMERLEEAESEGEEQVRLLREEMERLQKMEASLQSTRAEREYYERMKSDAARDAKELGEEIADLERRLRKIERSLKESGARHPSTRPRLLDLRRKEHSTESKVKKLTGLVAAIETKLSDYESIMKRGVCPVCDRPVEAHDFGEKKARKDAERRHVADELKMVEGELASLRERIRKREERLKLQKEVEIWRAERSRLRRDMAKKQAGLKKFEKRSVFAGETLRQLAKRIEELEGVLDERRVAEAKLGQTEVVLRKVRDDLSKAKALAESVKKREREISTEIMAKEDALNRGKRLREREIWLGDYFIPTVKVIEKSVLATINEEFDSLFKRWFAMLVADPDKEVSVDDDFTPIVSQGGYEQDVRYLSGGERTSVALAYRLALNMLAQRVSVGMKSNLLILDEPTDGFSREQLGNVREALDEVGSPQVIIVSHDKELESFADQIFRIEKTGSDSMVRTPTN